MCMDFITNENMTVLVNTRCFRNKADLIEESGIMQK